MKYETVVGVDFMLGSVCIESETSAHKKLKIIVICYNALLRTS